MELSPRIYQILLLPGLSFIKSFLSLNSNYIFTHHSFTHFSVVLSFHYYLCCSKKNDLLVLLIKAAAVLMDLTCSMFLFECCDFITTDQLSLECLSACKLGLNRVDHDMLSLVCSCYKSLGDCILAHHFIFNKTGENNRTC